MNSPIKRLTKRGVEKAIAIFTSRDRKDTKLVRLQCDALLNDTDNVEIASTAVFMDQADIPDAIYTQGKKVLAKSGWSRFQIGEYFDQKFTQAGFKTEDVNKDYHLWAWTIVFFSRAVTHPGGTESVRLVPATFIPGEGAGRLYRHLFIFPYRMYKMYGLEAICLLDQKVHTPADIVEKFSYQKFWINPTYMKFGSFCFVAKVFNSGDRDGRGAHRHFVRWLDQLTVDQEPRTVKDMLPMLPNEFKSKIKWTPEALALLV